MTQPDYETKDVHTNMMAEGEGFETKDLPGGYAPAAVPNIDRTGTQKQDGPKSGEGDGEAAPSDASSSEGAASKTTSSRSKSSGSGSK